MSNIGDGMSDLAVEQNADIAKLQAAVRGARQAAEQVKLPATGFVSSVNGESGAVNIQAGTSSAGVTVVVTNGVGTISIGVTGFGTLATVKCNVDVSAPLVTDDSDAGYSQFSQWIDTMTSRVYLCIDATVGAAIWVQIT